MARSGASAGPSVLFRPVADLWRLRARVTLDLLLTLGVTALAIGLAVAYQVVGRWARRRAA